MAVMENVGATAMASSNRDAQQNDVAPDHHQSTKPASAPAPAAATAQKSTKPTDQNYHLTQQKISNGPRRRHQHPVDENGVDEETEMDGDREEGEGFKKEMRDLEEMLSKLNPMAKEFVPPSLGGHQSLVVAGHFGYNANGFVVHQLVNSCFPSENFFSRKKNGLAYNGNRKRNSRTSVAQREDVIRRTVYVSDIDHQVTEEQLAVLFLTCGQVVDCRICGDPNSVLRFAFIEFTDEEGAKNALSLGGTVLGYYPVRVLPSKTAIAPVNPTYLPRSEDEREMCARTIYCTNIDKKITQSDVKLFFESFCGQVNRLRLLGDYHHSTRIAFVEFVMAESAIAALNCSGAVLGSLPIRVSPSKTPVRPRAPRQPIG